MFNDNFLKMKVQRKLKIHKILSAFQVCSAINKQEQ